jgi:hypothetical protein
MKTATLLMLCALLGAAAQGATRPDPAEAAAAAIVPAIETIERSSGGRVVDARFSVYHGHGGFHAVVVREHRLELFHLDTHTHAVEQVEAASAPVWMLAWRDRTDLEGLLGREPPKITLVEAIGRAEKSLRGATAFAAGVARRPANPTQSVHTYAVLLSLNGRVQAVSVDESTGDILDEPGELVG